VAVGAHNIALRDLGDQRLPAVITKPPCDVKLLVFEMIELEDEGIELAAVETAPFAEKVDDVLGAFGH
jgi:hypothetical protein